jgi:hypothetical protein
MGRRRRRKKEKRKKIKKKEQKLRWLAARPLDKCNSE